MHLFYIKKKLSITPKRVPISTAPGKFKGFKMNFRMLHLIKSCFFTVDLRILCHASCSSIQLPSIIYQPATIVLRGKTKNIASCIILKSDNYNVSFFVGYAKQSQIVHKVKNIRKVFWHENF